MSWTFIHLADLSSRENRVREVPGMVGFAVCWVQGHRTPSCLGAAALVHEDLGTQLGIHLASIVFGHTVLLVPYVLPCTILLLQKPSKGFVSTSLSRTSGLHAFTCRGEGMHLPPYTWPTPSPACFPNINTWPRSPAKVVVDFKQVLQNNIPEGDMYTIPGRFLKYKFLCTSL